MVKRAFVGFAGFGGVDIALRGAGYDVVGVEIDDAIAQVARDNGHNTITADILDIDPRDYTGWELMHFSPPCPSFSIANQQSSESEYDILLAEKITQFIAIAQPRLFTLENVYQYRKSESWRRIIQVLFASGYMVDVGHLNAADYGVPQTRKRMIVRAMRNGFVPYMPPAMPWVGWYEAIEDLLPTLPDSQFADWQLMRMPDELKTMLMMTSNTNKLASDSVQGRGWLDIEQPSNTVNTYSNGSMPRAFLLGNGQRSAPKLAHQPADTITSNSNQMGIRATLVNGQNSSTARNRAVDEPAMTVTALHKGFPRAFIVDCQKSGTPDKDNGLRGLTIRESTQPMFTVTSTATKRTVRALTDVGRVVSMTPRALARFQSMPDNYILPKHNKLACKGIGNAVPPKMYEAVLRSLGEPQRILEAEGGTP